MKKIFLPLVFLLGALGHAQVVHTFPALDSNNTWTGVNDFTGVPHSLPVKVGLNANKPATCTVGEFYFASDVSAGQNLFICTAPNVFSQPGSALPAGWSLTADNSFTSTFTHQSFSLNRTFLFPDLDMIFAGQSNTTPATQAGNGLAGAANGNTVQGQNGGATSGSTGQTAGNGATAQLLAGNGGNAPAGSTNGNGGNVVVNGGSAGSGAGTAGTIGNVGLQTAGGKVGIGTASPSTLLNVSGPGPIITSTNTNSSGQAFQLRNGVASGSPQLVTNTFDIFGSSSGKSIITVLDTGGAGNANEVRIGTSTNINGNSSRLFVFGGAQGANVDVLADGTQQDVAGVEVEGSDYATIQDSTRIDYWGPNATFSGSSFGFPNVNIGRLLFSSTSATVPVAGIISISNGNPLVFGNASMESMRITNGGNVGIAIGAPTIASLEVPGSLSFDALPRPPSVTANNLTAGGAVTVGTHSWVVTFVNAVGETIAGPTSLVRNASSSNRTEPITNIALGPIGTTARKIYRTVAGDTGNYLFVATINDNTTTTFSDTIADGSLGAAAPTTNTTALGSIQVQDASGTNVVGGVLTIRSGGSTGSAAPSLIQVDGSASGGASGTTLATQVHRVIVNDTKSLTSGAATTLVSIPLASGQMTGGKLDFYMEATDGTNQCTYAAQVAYAAENTGGTFVTSTSVLGTAANACTATKTLTATFAMTSANPTLLQVTPTLGGITATRFTAIYEIHHMGQTNPTP